MKKKVILIIRDGWGVRKDEKGNYIKQGEIKNIDFYEKNYPYTELFASGNEVGIPEGKMGNSEVGHLHIGAGRIIPQSLLKIDNAIKDKSFFKNKAWKNSLKNAKENNSKINIFILMQEAGVHAHINHLFAYLDFLKENNFYDFNLHLISDGRDHNPKTFLDFYQKLIENFGKEIEKKVKTISGRFFAMDRNKNYERTEKYFNTVVFGKSEKKFSNLEKFILENYEKNIFDEFIEPAVKKDYNGFRKNDSVVFLNFRTDRVRQISEKFCEKSFLENKKIKYFTMTKYYNNICSETAFEFSDISDTLSDILIKNNKKQLRLAESEKMAHVTFFFDGQRKVENHLVEKIILESPNVKTYNLAPEMRAKELAEIAIKKIDENEKDFILMNFANADMVGHTGNKEAILKAVKAVDRAVKKIVDKSFENKNNEWVVILAADHGNAEDKTDKFKTSHTLNKIPFSIISNDEKIKNLKLKNNLGLKNIAPTVLEIMGIEKDSKMKESIILKKIKK